MEVVLFAIMGCVIVYLSVLNYVQLREFRKERQVLIDKLMSRDFTDYTTNYMYAQQNGNEGPTPEEILAQKLDEQLGIPVGS